LYPGTGSSGAGDYLTLLRLSALEGNPVKIKTSELTGAALDWAVAKCEQSERQPIGHPAHFSPSTNWAQGGPIINRERLAMSHYSDELGWACFQAHTVNGVFCKDWFGPTPIIAAMRCYVASKLGDTVDITDYLAP
jgi:hypothetical protein